MIFTTQRVLGMSQILYAKPTGYGASCDVIEHFPFIARICLNNEFSPLPTNNPSSIPFQISSC